MAKKNYEDFPLSLALFDALPVIFFSVAMIFDCNAFQKCVFYQRSGTVRGLWIRKSALAQHLHLSFPFVFPDHSGRYDLHECLCCETGWDETPLQLD